MGDNVKYKLCEKDNLYYLTKDPEAHVSDDTKSSPFPFYSAKRLRCASLNEGSQQYEKKHLHYHTLGYSEPNINYLGYERVYDMNMHGTPNKCCHSDQNGHLFCQCTIFSSSDRKY